MGAMSSGAQSKAMERLGRQPGPFGAHRDRLVGSSRPHPAVDRAQDAMVGLVLGGRLDRR